MRTSEVTRRGAMVGAGALAVSATVPGAANATPQAARDWLLAQTEGKAPQAGRVTIEGPEVAENGASINLGVSIDSPMTAANHVTGLWVAADGNPNPGVLSLTLGPDLGKASVQFRVRLAQTSTVHAVARMSDGSLWSARREVKVTVGGCGG
jgi:sulfur-oxidizing protein SoxY